MFRKIAIMFVLILMLSLVACGSAAEAPLPTLVEVTPLPAATEPPTAEPPTAEPTATEPPPTEPPTAEVSTAELVGKIDTLLSNQADDNRFSGSVLLVQDDEVILSEGYGLANRDQEIPNTPTTRFRIGSLTKAFTAMAIMMLQEQGLLTVDDLICDYLDDCPEIWNQVTIHHLLIHTSGIFNYTDLPGYPDDASMTQDDVIRQVAELPLDFNPGSTWSYSNTGYLLLGKIIERISGQSYETYLQENIFNPLGMVNTGIEKSQDEIATGYTRFLESDSIDMSIPGGAGALYSTIEDMYHWVQALQSDELVSPATRDLIFTQYTPGSCGYGWFYETIHGRPVWEHYGSINGFNSRLSIFPEDEVISIILANREDMPLDVIGDIMTKWTLGIE